MVRAEAQGAESLKLYKVEFKSIKVRRNKESKTIKPVAVVAASTEVEARDLAIAAIQRERRYYYVESVEPANVTEISTPHILHWDEIDAEYGF